MAELAKFQIKRGLSTNLFNEDGSLNEKIVLVEGCWYLTTDTAEVYVAQYDDNNILKLQRINDVDTFSEPEVINVSSRKNLPTIGNEDNVYIIVDENSTYRWDSTLGDYFCVGRDYNEIRLINGGSAKI